MVDATLPNHQKRLGVFFRICQYDPVLTVIFIVSTLILSLDHNSWKYACFGDEWALYYRASQILKSGLFSGAHVFGPLRDGVYAVHTPFLSFVQAVAMFIFGENNFGWRMSGTLSLTLSIFPLAVICKYFLERRTSYLVVIGVVWSPYLLAESKWGYGWGLMRLFPLCAVASLITFRKSPTILTAILVAFYTSTSDLIGGFGKYVALLTTGYITVFILTKCSHRRFRLLTVFLSVLLASSKIPQHLYGNEGILGDLRRTLWKTSAGPYVASFLGADWGKTFEATAPAPSDFWPHFLGMLGSAITAPVSFRGNAHLVVGKVIEPILGWFVLGGMLLSLIALVVDRRWISMWLFFLPGLVLAGALSPYHDLAITRLHFLVPMWGIFGGLALEKSLGLLIKKKWLSDAMVVSYCCWIIMWGCQSFWVEMPHRHEFSKTDLAVKLLDELGERDVIFVFDYWHPLDIVIPNYPHRSRAHIVKTPSVEDLDKYSQMIDSVFVFPRKSQLSQQQVDTYERFLLSIPSGMECLPYRYGEQIPFEVCRKPALDTSSFDRSKRCSRSSSSNSEKLVV